MSLFDDDFYSTRVRRRARRDPVMRWKRNSALRAALVSSLASSLLVSAIFIWALSGRGEPDSVPAIAPGQMIVETSERIISAAARVRPAVVSVINMIDPWIEEDAAEDEDESLWMERASLGSGIIFDKRDGKAFIMTNAHVVQDAAEVRAVLIDGTTKIAEIVGADIISDLAVLAVDDEGIEAVAEIGDSRKLRVGEMVIAIGNPLGFGDSITQGIVSSTREIIPVSLNRDGIYDWEQEVIQTDAAINQGNSGGALVDLDGKVVGINSMKVADMGVEGLGFAIPMHTAYPILESLLEYGKVKRPYMGIYSMDLSVYLENNALEDDDEEAGEGEEDWPDTNPLVVPDGVKRGVIVLEAVGPALEAGLELNDIIVMLDDTKIRNTMELRKYLYNEKKIGDDLKVTYYRNGEKKTLSLGLVEKPGDEEE